MMFNLARELHSGWPLRFAFTLFVSFIVYNLKMNSFMPSFKCWRKQGFKTNLFECVSALLTLIADAFIILLLYLLGLVRVRILFLYLLGRLHIDYMEHIIVQKLYRLPYLHFFNGFSFLFIKKKNMDQLFLIITLCIYSLLIGRTMGMDFQLIYGVLDALYWRC